MSWAIAALILVALIAIVVLRGARKYRRLLAPEHLLELGGGLARLKEAVFSAPPDLAEPDPERHSFVSSAQLILAYTCSRPHEAHQHHLSLSYRGGPLALGAAGVVIAFCARLLGAPVEHLQVGRSDRGVYHIAWALDDPAHEALRNATLAIPTIAEMPSVMAVCFQDARRLGPIARIPSAPT
ncbi:hypothetical protein [Chondromyces crocatus]|uniref:Uncharacterized protein n=1 Tax=Chondromyces crocatus TaxID=52 RepID=A0A0K1ES71_CHOCO|nr:hypothetical protein [Chondromyces crocatus]AKT43706.1 uncharacterized protein CMC5_079410 [Chondromyces crocatus]